MFRRFRITKLETAEVPAGLATHLVGTREIACVRGVQKNPEATRMAFAMGRENGNWLYAAGPPAGSGGGLKWQTWQTFAIPKSRLSCFESGGRERKELSLQNEGKFVVFDQRMEQIVASFRRP
jgi:hypothetical protein